MESFFYCSEGNIVMEKLLYVYHYDIDQKRIIKYMSRYDDEQTIECMKGKMIKLTDLSATKRVYKIPLDKIDSFNCNINENLYLSREDDVVALEHYKNKYDEKCKELNKQLKMYKKHLRCFEKNIVDVCDKE